MLHNDYVDAYIQRYKNGELVLNKKRKQLIEWLEKDILPQTDSYFFDNDMIDKYIKFSEKFYFELDEWEKFIAPFVFLFEKERRKPVFRIFILVMARGAGKNGFISTLAHFFISSFHGIDKYDVSIVANSEEQAQTSFNEVFNEIIANNMLSAIHTRDTIFEKGETLHGEFEPWKSRIYSQKTQSNLKFHASNAATKDGGREGCIIFDEFHQYENSELVKVFTGGLGKIPHPRQFFIGTKGFEREGYFDMMYGRCERILNGETHHNGLFPFICELDEIEEMDDPDMWEKANPALQKPLNDRGERLQDTIKDEYVDLQDEPSGRPAFVTKRMNFLEGDYEHSVASRDELMATNREPFNLEGLIPIGGMDFGSVRDFASCGMLFKKEEEYYFHQHSFVIKDFVDKHYGYSNTANTMGGGKKAPIKEWERMGLLTVIDEPSLNPEYVVDYYIKMREKYGVNRIVADNFKMDLLRPLFEREGFEVDALKNPRSLHVLIAPRIEDAFANHKIIFGDDPMMRWYTNNVFVKETNNGKVFEKKEETKRKTDGFHAFFHSMYRANELDELNDIGGELDLLEALW